MRERLQLSMCKWVCARECVSQRYTVAQVGKTPAAFLQFLSAPPPSQEETGKVREIKKKKREEEESSPCDIFLGVCVCVLYPAPPPPLPNISAHIPRPPLSAPFLLVSCATLPCRSEATPLTPGKHSARREPRRRVQRWSPSPSCLLHCPALTLCRATLCGPQRVGGLGGYN